MIGNLTIMFGLHFMHLLIGHFIYIVQIDAVLEFSSFLNGSQIVLDSFPHFNFFQYNQVLYFNVNIFGSSNSSICVGYE